MRIVLASASAPRKRLLEQSGHILTIIPSDCAEASPIDGDIEDAKRVCCNNAELKGTSVLRNIASTNTISTNNDFLIAADTLVVVPGLLTVGKPKSIDDAHHMYDIFEKNKIVVITGVFLYCFSTKKSLTYSALTSLVMKPLSVEDRQTLFNKVTPLGKAGGFSITSSPEIFSSIEGSITNAEGFPLETIDEHLRALL